MANLEIIALDTAVPQLRAPGVGDGYVATRQVNFGVAGTVKGVVTLSGNTSGTVTVQPAAAAGTWTMTLPTSAGSNGYVLQTNGSGVTSWVAQSSSALPGGSYGNFQYNATTGGVQTIIVPYGSDNGHWASNATYTNVSATGGHGSGCLVNIQTDTSGPVDTYDMTSDNELFSVGGGGGGNHLTGGSGTGATCNWTGPVGSPGPLTAFSIDDPGVGYHVGDVLTLENGSGIATITVTGIDPSEGKVTTYSIANPGSGYGVNDTLTVDEPSSGTGQIQFLVIGLVSPVSAFGGIGAFDSSNNNALLIASGDLPAGYYDVICSGSGNSTTDSSGGYNFIGNGYNNEITGTNQSRWNVIGSGNYNVIQDTDAGQPQYSFIGTGYSNELNAPRSVIVSGSNNEGNGEGAFFGNGQNNTINGIYSSIVNGISNTIDGSYSAAFGVAGSFPRDYCIGIASNNTFSGGATIGGSQTSTAVYADTKLAASGDLVITVPVVAGTFVQAELTYNGTSTADDDSWKSGKTYAMCNYGQSAVTNNNLYDQDVNDGSQWTVSLTTDLAYENFVITVADAGSGLDSNWTFVLTLTETAQVTAI